MAGPRQFYITTNDVTVYIDPYLGDYKDHANLARKPKAVIPMHRWDTDPTAFRKGVEKAGITDIVLLNPGEAYVLR